MEEKAEREGDRGRRVGGELRCVRKCYRGKPSLTYPSRRVNESVRTKDGDDHHRSRPTSSGYETLFFLRRVAINQGLIAEKLAFISSAKSEVRWTVVPDTPFSDSPRSIDITIRANEEPL